MTRTQKLGLCTWLPEDPVCLAEVNDNFSRLDASGGQALRQARAGLITLGGLMSAQAHQGGHAVYSDSIQVDAFQDTEQVADYTGSYFLNKQVELLTAGRVNCVIECKPTIGDDVMALAKKLAAGEDIPRCTYSEEAVFTEFDADLQDIPPRGY